MKNKNKPHIFFKQNLGWVCISLWATGRGRSPVAAFNDWRIERNLWAALSGIL